MSYKGFEIQEENVIQEKAILAGAIINESKASDDSLYELARLAETAGAVVVERLIQRRDKIHPGTYFGKGKIEELKTLCQSTGATLIIFDDDLSPAQSKNIEEITETRVIDRSELILDIFAINAKSKEAKVQVELAQLKYALPRLKRMWTHLDRYEGGIGLRGPGEKQIEDDKRIARKRIGDLTSLIKEIQARKEREVENRNENFVTAGLLGYTNAGKSTLMNTLTSADVFVADKLFSTLDTKTGLWKLGEGEDILISDTVGFINKLPHHLVASFKATLEEAKRADILLHVIDISHPDVILQIQTVENVLSELHFDGQPILNVFNKVDIMKDQVEISQLKDKYPNHVLISAKTGQGIEELTRKVRDIINQNKLEVTLKVPNKDGKILSWLSTRGKILNKEYTDKDVVLQVRLSVVDTERIKRYVIPAEPPKE